MTKNFIINNREYSSIIIKTSVVICLDGSQKEYLDEASKANLTPNLDKIINKGEYLIAHSAIPSFTNPNNISIVTGQPSSVHGICGNFFYTPSTGEEVMMNDPQYLRAPTIFEKYYELGAKIVLVTAKDKLRTLLGNGLKYDDKRAICFSAEKSNKANMEHNGIENVNEWLGMPVPKVYSADLSEFVMAAGVKLMKEYKPDIMYLSTTDYIQHKYEPGHEVANKFYSMFDSYIGQLDNMGAMLVITADHGMKSKSKKDGSPNAIFLQDHLFIAHRYDAHSDPIGMVAMVQGESGSESGGESDGSACQTQMAKLCVAARRSGAGNCLVCMRVHQNSMRAAKCTPHDFDVFCKH